MSLMYDVVDLVSKYIVFLFLGGTSRSLFPLSHDICQSGPKLDRLGQTCLVY